MKLTLFQKAAIFIAIQLAIQIGLACGFFYLQNEAERYAKEEAHAREVSTTLNDLGSDVLHLMGTTGNDSFTDSTFSFAKYGRDLHSIKRQLDTLADLVKDDPKMLALVSDARQHFVTAQQLIAQTIDAYRRGNMHEVLETARKTHSIMKTYGVQFSQDAMQQVEREEQEIRERLSREEAQNREQARNLLIFLISFNVAITFIALYVFTRLITNRLGVLMRNSFRLAKNEPLERELSGSDEIAGLDLALHQVAKTLAEAKRRERAIVDNALDVICSTDDKLRFKVLNPACLPVLGYTPDELEGNRLTNIVFHEDVNRTSDLIQSMMQSDERSATIENRVKHKDGKVVDVHWSLHWSKAQQSFFCVARDVSERKEAERMKQEIVQMVTHDLRSPLSAIQNFHELLEIGICGDLSEKGFNMLRAAQRSGNRMMRLINQLLDLEKIKDGMMTLDVKQTALMELFEQASQAVPATGGPDGVSLDVLPTDLMIQCDPDRIVQVLTNLLANAVKFSQPGAKVILSAEAKDDLVEISVQDSGRGVPEEMLSKIFEPFQQVLGTDATAKGGTGLGLAICRGIIELHGGTITVDSHEGAGSTFRIVLPIKKVSMPAAHEPAAQSIKTDEVHERL